MADDLKQVVVDAVIKKVKELDGTLCYTPRRIRVLTQVERLSIQLEVKTQTGPRYFMVKVQEKY